MHLLGIFIAAWLGTNGHALGQGHVASAQTPVAGQTVTVLSDGRTLESGGQQHGQAVATVTLVDPHTDARISGAPLLFPRWRHTATVLGDGRVLILGGIGVDGQDVQVAELFDPRTDASVAIPAAIIPRAGHSATLLPDGKVLVLGGDGSEGRVATVQMWDPESDDVSALPVTWADARRDHTAILQGDGSVLIVGGRGENEAAPSGALERFDPARASFAEVTSTSSKEAAPIRLMETVPGPASHDVDVDVRVALAFSDVVGNDGFGTFTIEGPAGTVPATVVRAEGGRLFFVVPGSRLSAGATYRVSLTGLHGSLGRPVIAPSFSFTTSAKAGPVATPNDEEAWTPIGHRWVTDRPPSPWQQLPSLRAADGVTALAGQTLLLNGRPLAGVTLSLGGQRVESDTTGRFLLQSIPSGVGKLLIDGRSAGSTGRQFGVFEVLVNPTAGRTTALEFSIWMPRIDDAHAVTITNPTRMETVITTPFIPGLEVHIPAGVTVKDHEGRLVTQVSITPIPVDRPPFPLPTNVQVPIYFTIQPGGGFLQGTGAWPPGARIVYPNYRGDRPRARVNFWNYDPEGRGWHIYGLGRVDASAKQVVPDPGVQIYAFTGAMINDGNTPPDEGPRPGRKGGDPVDLATGLFVYEKTDLFEPDVIPLSLTRIYRQNDPNNRPFGIGATHPYAMFLWSAQQYQQADLILPDGARIHYDRTSAGTGFADAEFEHTSTPTKFYKSRITWNGAGWNLTLTDGTVYKFGDNAPLQSITDRYGNRVTVTWSSIRQPSGIGEGQILRVTAPNGRYIAFTYDTNDRITEARDNLDRAVEYEYDASGRLSQVTDAAGGVTQYTYDSADRMLTIQDPRSITYLTNAYDANGRVSVQTQADSSTYQFAYTLDGSGHVVQTDVTNPRGYVNRSVFNTAGYETTFTEAVGNALERMTTYSRDATSQRVTSTTDPLSRRTDFAYDTPGNLTSVTRLAGTGNAVTTSWTYESVYQQVATMTDPLSHTTTLSYDGGGRLTGITDPLSHLSTVSLTNAGQVSSVTDPLGHTTSLDYAFGDLSVATDGLGRATRFFTDVAGRRIAVTDALGNRTAVAYTPLNLPATITDPAGGQTSFTYDGNGNLLTLTDARSAVTTWTYDGLDRVATRTDPLTHTESYQYDANGNLRQRTDRKGQVTTYTYDALDRLSTATYQGGATATYTYDAGNRVTQIADTATGSITRNYDDLDRLTGETTAQGTLTYTYDAAGRRATATVTGQSAVGYSYDAANHLTGVTQGSASVTLGYDLAGRRTSQTLPNGVTTAYGLDAADQLTSLAWTAGATTLGDLAYEYDSAGRRTSVGGTFARTNIPPALGSATYDLSNRIATWDGTAFTYDLNGNLTSDGTSSYTWDDRDQLTSLSGPTPGNFTYDAAGRRTSRAVGGVTTSYLYDAMDVVQEQIGGSASANYLLGLGIDERFARTDATGTAYYLADALQSTVALADGTGTVQTSYTYEPFGATTQSGVGAANPARYTGREEDGTALYFYRAVLRPATTTVRQRGSSRFCWRRRQLTRVCGELAHKLHRSTGIVSASVRPSYCRCGISCGRGRSGRGGRRCVVCRLETRTSHRGDDTGPNDEARRAHER